MTPARQLGPWAPNLDPAERRARLRALRAIARILAGPRADDFVKLLAEAERNEDALVPAADALDRLAPLDQRRVLGSYAGLARPAPRTGTHGESRHLPWITARPVVWNDPSRPRPLRSRCAA